MTEAEIIEGNKLVLDSPFAKENHVLWRTKYEKYSSEKFDYTLLKYHSSWDWLMPVVEKIIPYGLFRLVIGNVNSACHFENDFHGTTKHTNESTIIAVWEAVVEFIKLFNLQSTNQQ